MSQGEGKKMKRAILSTRSRLILEAVTLALKSAGIAVERTSSQSAPEILKKERSL